MTARRRYRPAIIAGLIAMVLTGLFLPAASAQEAAQQFLSAVTDYENGDYLRAAETLEAIADSGIRNADLYYNLGNAWFRAGDIGRAVLWYEKARKITPDDPELTFNLDYARGFVKDQQPEAFSVLKAIFFWRYLLSRKMTVMLASISAALFCVSFFSRKFLKKRPPGWVVAVCLGGWAIFAATAGFNFYAESVFTQGVILPTQVSVKSGLSDISTELFVLHAGSRVAIEEARKDYYRIRFGSNKIGWLKADMVGVI